MAVSASPSRVGGLRGQVKSTCAEGVARWSERIGLDLRVYPTFPVSQHYSHWLAARAVDTPPVFQSASPVITMARVAFTVTCLFTGLTPPRKGSSGLTVMATVSRLSVPGPTILNRHAKRR